MQFRLLTAFMIFLGSYLPLAVILFLQNIDYNALNHSPLRSLHNPAWSIGAVILTAMCFGLTVFALTLVRTKHEITVREAEYIPTDLMNYTMPYVVSFMGISYHETDKFLGFCVFLLWMFWITYKSGQIFLNPLLIVLGWRLYKITYHFAGSTDLHKGRVIINGHLEPGLYKQWPVEDILIIKLRKSNIDT